MLTQIALFLTIFAFFILEDNKTNSFKTAEDLRSQYKQAEKEAYSRSDIWVGKAMDFVYSNKTIMSLIARELWDVGSRAIDRIVEVNDKKKRDTKRPSLRDAAKQEPRDYRPTKWLANSAMDVWYGNKSMIDIIAREMSDVMLKLTARPVSRDWPCKMSRFVVFLIILLLSYTCAAPVI
ncbi:hypothetical protein B5X24_HaOG209437 [Helicoverpa armigera]|uniref:Uncharacterized protein n=1 Tax=Helicoverpa armigera TaxID=29058 RepID=A0A2W1BEG6_HELAM|nr:hypothetical protein B5X24_HaOG209437 [Helicoverpa armigera]